MPVCITCGGGEFHLDSGLYYCVECHTQSQDLRQEEKEDEGEAHAFSFTVKSPKKQQEAGTKRLFYSQEIFNVILRKQVDALISLGASPALKKIVLCLWTKYLQQCEVAFQIQDPEEEWIPRLNLKTRRSDYLHARLSTTGNAPFSPPKYPKRVSSNLILTFTGQKCQKNREASRFRKRKKAARGKIKNKNKEDKAIEEDKGEEEVEAMSEPESKTEELIQEKETDTLSEPMDETIDAADDHTKSGAADAVKQVKVRNKNRTEHLLSNHGKQLLKQLRKKKKTTERVTIKSLEDRVVTMSKTICFCHLGLLLLEEEFYLSDIIRWIKDEQFPFKDIDLLLPAFIIENLCNNQKRIFHEANTVLETKPFCQEMARLAVFLGIYELPLRQLLPLVARVILDLNLPGELISVCHKLITEYRLDVKWCVEEDNYSYRCAKSIPHHEARAAAVILVALKLLFVLNDKYERKCSGVAQKINAFFPQINLFVWTKWKEHMGAKINFLELHSYPVCNSLEPRKVLKVNTLAAKTRNSRSRDYNKLFRESIRKLFSDLHQSSQMPVVPASSFPLTTATDFFLERLSGEHLFPIDVIKQSFTHSSLLYLRNFSAFCETMSVVTELEEIKETVTSLGSHLKEEKKPYWHIFFHTGASYYRKRMKDIHLPKSFSFVLNVISRLVQTDTADVYKEVMSLEKLMKLHL